MSLPYSLMSMMDRPPRWPQGIHLIAIGKAVPATGAGRAGDCHGLVIVLSADGGIQYANVPQTRLHTALPAAPCAAPAGDAGVLGEFTPGQRVRHPAQPDWGPGQVQSAVGKRVTVNFENAGKVLINIDHVTLEVIEDETT